MAGVATKVDGQLAACDVLPSQAIFSSFKPREHTNDCFPPYEQASAWDVAQLGSFG